MNHCLADPLAKAGCEGGGPCWCDQAAMGIALDAPRRKRIDWPVLGIFVALAVLGLGTLAMFGFALIWMFA